MSEEEKGLKQLIALYEGKQFQAAVNAATEFTKKYPNNGTGLNLLGLSHKACGNIKESVSIFEHLITASPEVAMFHSNLGNLRLMTGKVKESITCFEKAVSLDPKLINAIEALGLSYLEVDKKQRAERCFIRVLELDPSHERSLYYLGNFYLIDRQWSKAADLLRRSNFGLSQSHYLECLLCLKKGKEFLEFYQALSRRGITNPLVGGLVGHVRELYKREVDNSFCNDALDYIYVGNISENDGFTASLAEDLMAYHREAKSDYRSQALLHKGEQSSGNLFLLDKPFAQQLKRLVEKEITQYRQKFENHNQGFLAKWPDRYELFGWLVSMRAGGNLDSHNHKEGWLSGSFYLKLPESRMGQNDEGKIAFSYKGPRYPSDGYESRRKIIDIKTRDICMFPSSLFHETLPFQSNEERVSFAFDLKPKS